MTKYYCYRVQRTCRQIEAAQASVAAHRAPFSCCRGAICEMTWGKCLARPPLSSCVAWPCLAAHVVAAF